MGNHLESLNINTNGCYTLMGTAKHIFKYSTGVFMQDNQNQTHWAYVAGIMDADGCFMISKHKRKTSNKKTKRALEFPKNIDHWSCTYMPALKIAMIEPEAVSFIKNELGYGNIGIDGARKDRPKSKPIYHWYARNWRQVIPFIENVLPYLKVKKNRAQHLLLFCKHLQKQENPCYRGLSKDELNYREESYIRMREFNGNKVGATTKPRECESISDSLIS
jgi:hypothetical protein